MEQLQRNSCNPFRCELFRCELFRCELFRCESFRCESFRCESFRCERAAIWAELDTGEWRMIIALALSFAFTEACSLRARAGQARACGSTKRVFRQRTLVNQGQADEQAPSQQSKWAGSSDSIRSGYDPGTSGYDPGTSGYDPGTSGYGRTERAGSEWIDRFTPASQAYGYARAFGVPAAGAAIAFGG